MQIFTDKSKQFAANASFDDLIIPFLATINELVMKFGNWQVAWEDQPLSAYLIGN